MRNSILLFSAVALCSVAAHTVAMDALDVVADFIPKEEVSAGSAEPAAGGVAPVVSGGASVASVEFSSSSESVSSESVAPTPAPVNTDSLSSAPEGSSGSLPATVEGAGLASEQELPSGTEGSQGEVGNTGDVEDGFSPVGQGEVTEGYLSGVIRMFRENVANPAYGFYENHEYPCKIVAFSVAGAGAGALVAHVYNVATGKAVSKKKAALVAGVSTAAASTGYYYGPAMVAYAKSFFERAQQ